MKGLKLLNKIYVLWAAGLAALLLSSCEAKGFNILPDYAENAAIVTVVPFAEDSCYFIHQGDTLFDPRYSNHFGNREVRAFMDYRTVVGPYYSKYFNAMITEIDVYRIDSIITRQIEPDLGMEENDEVYGREPIEFYHEDYYNYNCYTHIADGYLHLHVAMPVGDSGCLHGVSLIPFAEVPGGTPAENHFELRHKMTGNMTPYDPLTAIFGETVVAFDIKALNQEANGGCVTIVLDNALTQESIDLPFGTEPIKSPYGATRNHGERQPIDPETIL